MRGGEVDPTKSKWTPADREAQEAWDEGVVKRQQDEEERIRAARTRKSKFKRSMAIKELQRQELAWRRDWGVAILAKERKMRAISKRRKKHALDLDYVFNTPCITPSQRVPRWRMGSQGWAASILLWCVCLLALIAPAAAADEMDDGNWPALGAALGAAAAAAGRQK